MAKKTTLNAKNLEALGAARLAELLLEITDGNAAAKRRLRMELAAMQSPADLAREVRKRLGNIARARSFVDWRGVRALAHDLDTQRQAIVETVGKDDPKTALDLLWRFMDLADPVLHRCDDSSGLVGDEFRTACDDLGDLACKAEADPEALADRAFDALNDNGFGQFDRLIPVLAPALGEAGLAHLKQRMVELSNTPVERPADEDRVEVMWGSGGPTYADEVEERSRRSTVRLALKDIADALGDVDAFIAQYDERTRKVPRIAAEIAQRLLAADRAEEALAILDAADHDGPASILPVFDWEDARIAVLDALGRAEEAQQLRWFCFEQTLSDRHLRAYLKRLADFEDVEAEEKALDHAKKSHDNPLKALSFLLSWPALDRAAAVVIAHADELDGDFYELLPRRRRRSRTSTRWPPRCSCAP